MRKNIRYYAQAREMLKDKALSVNQMLDRWPTRSAPTHSSLGTLLRSYSCPNDGGRPVTWGPWP